MMNNGKWYNIELPFDDEMKTRVNHFKAWLHDNKIKFETSACGKHVHFEIYATIQQAMEANNALNNIVWCQ